MSVLVQARLFRGRRVHIHGNEVIKMGVRIDERKRKEDDFLKKTKCDRCGGPLTVRTMSMFNMDVICPDCKRAERERPDYGEALEAERAAVAAGDRNFAGIGLKPIETVVGRLEE